MFERAISSVNEVVDGCHQWKVARMNSESSSSTSTIIEYFGMSGIWIAVHCCAKRKRTSVIFVANLHSLPWNITSKAHKIRTMLKRHTRSTQPCERKIGLPWRRQDDPSLTCRSTLGNVPSRSCIGWAPWVPLVVLCGVLCWALCEQSLRGGSWRVGTPPAPPDIFKVVPSGERVLQTVLATSTSLGQPSQVCCHQRIGGSRCFRCSGRLGAHRVGQHRSGHPSEDKLEVFFMQRHPLLRSIRKHGTHTHLPTTEKATGDLNFVEQHVRNCHDAQWVAASRDKFGALLSGREVSQAKETHRHVWANTHHAPDPRRHQTGNCAWDLHFLAEKSHKHEMTLCQVLSNTHGALDPTNPQTHKYAWILCSVSSVACNQYGLWRSDFDWKGRMAAFTSAGTTLVTCALSSSGDKESSSLSCLGVCFWLAACVCDLLVVIHRSQCPSMAVYGMLVSAHGVACPCANARQSSVKQ